MTIVLPLPGERLYTPGDNPVENYMGVITAPRIVDNGVDNLGIRCGHAAGPRDGLQRVPTPSTAPSTGRSAPTLADTRLSTESTAPTKTNHLFNVSNTAPSPGAESVDNPDWEWIRQTLLLRSGGRCEVTGAPFTGPDGWSVHHRQPRGMGGTRDPRIHDLTNLLAITGDGTRGVHGWIESHRDTAREHGWLVPRPLDPATVPVTLYSGRVVLLDTYGYLPTGHDPWYRDNPLMEAS